MVLLAWEVLAIAMLEVIGVVGEVLTAVTGEDVDVEVVMLGSVEHTVEGGGKKDPLASGIGRTGLGAVPTTFPVPGKVRAADAAATVLAAWYLAALSHYY